MTLMFQSPLHFRSAYLLYYYDIYLKVQQELPHLPQSEINKKISESWRLLSVAEKSYYLEKAKLEKEGLDPVSHLFCHSLPCEERGQQLYLFWHLNAYTALWENCLAADSSLCFCFRLPVWKQRVRQWISLAFAFSSVKG